MEKCAEKNNRMVYSVQEVADAMGISRTTAYQVVRGKSFPSFRVGDRIVIPRASFEDWLRREAERIDE